MVCLIAFQEGGKVSKGGVIRKKGGRVGGGGGARLNSDVTFGKESAGDMLTLHHHLPRGEREADAAS